MKLRIRSTFSVEKISRKRHNITERAVSTFRENTCFIGSSSPMHAESRFFTSRVFRSTVVVETSPRSATDSATQRPRSEKQTDEHTAFRGGSFWRTRTARVGTRPRGGRTKGWEMMSELLIIEWSVGWYVRASGFRRDFTAAPGAVGEPAWWPGDPFNRIQEGADRPLKLRTRRGRE